MKTTRRKTTAPRTAEESKVELPVLPAAAGKKRVLDARPDTPDFRDRLYEAALVEVPPRVTLEQFRMAGVPILDQGQEGACTGFGLATIANFLLRKRHVDPDPREVSPRMFYEMARRYDEWPGEDYSGSSARGAMKGWHKHGVCSWEVWPYDPNDPRGMLDALRAHDAMERPLGAYYRVNHQDLVCLHSALSEVGILYATSKVHSGWQSPAADGEIERTDKIIGGHAFAIVAYDEQGFWIQNSWGPEWGKDGYGHVSYDDWLANGTDVWVARLGAPVLLRTPEATAKGNSVAAGRTVGYTSADLRPHIISLANDGRLDIGGTYGKTVEAVKAIFSDDIPRITRSWKKRRILLYAHGGLVDEGSAVQRVADSRSTLLDSEVFPLAFIWHSDFWSTLLDILQDALGRRRPEGFLGRAADFMLDRLDDALEPVARVVGGKASWDEMKENALAATQTSAGGALLVANCLAEMTKKDPKVEIHLAGHSAGSIFHAPLVQALTSKGKIASGPLAGKSGLGLKVASCTLWAPACTVDLFKEAYLAPVRDGRVENFAMFTLTDKAEQDDNCARIYNKSLLYLVSNAFEKKSRIPLFRDGWPILGMEKFVREDAELKDLFKKKAKWILSPNDKPIGSPEASRSTSHGGFDDDKATLQATLARIIRVSAKGTPVTFHRSQQSFRGRREGINLMTSPVQVTRP